VPSMQPSIAPDPDRLTFYLLKNLNRAVREFAMIGEGDRVAVAVSGGKDSCALLHLLLARPRSVPQRHQLVALHVQMGPAGLTDLQPTLEPWFTQMEVEYAFAPLEVPEGETLPLDCHRCAWNRRKTLFTMAHQLGCNKLALAHHADDAAETTLLSLLQSGRLETLLPRREYFGGAITLIRPLIYTEERRLAQLARALGLPQDQPACPHAHTSQRAWVKRWLADAGRDRAQVRANLWRAARRQMGF
jgi:tRNA 2-thiocytidine biosynthesis protein TtcA